MRDASRCTHKDTMSLLPHVVTLCSPKDKTACLADASQCHWNYAKLIKPYHNGGAGCTNLEDVSGTSSTEESCNAACAAKANCEMFVLGKTGRA